MSMRDWSDWVAFRPWWPLRHQTDYVTGTRYIWVCPFRWIARRTKPARISYADPNDHEWDSHQYAPLHYVLTQPEDNHVVW